MMEAKRRSRKRGRDLLDVNVPSTPPPSLSCRLRSWTARPEARPARMTKASQRLIVGVLGVLDALHGTDRAWRAHLRRRPGAPGARCRLGSVWQ